MVARALAIVHTCMYDAWAVYDQKATGTQLGGSLRTDPAVRTHANTPASAVTLHWKTFHDAADQAGISRRYGGIHFRAADLVGRATGNMAAMNSWAKSLTYFDGRMERER